MTDIPPNPFGDMELPEEVETEVSNEMLGSLVSADGKSQFVSEQGPAFPAEHEPITVTAEITDGVAHVTSIVVDGATAAAAEKQAVTDVAIDMIDEHFGELAHWLAENMSDEIDRMSPSETMVQLVIRLLSATLPPVDGRGFVKDSTAIKKAQEAKKRRYGV